MTSIEKLGLMIFIMGVGMLADHCFVIGMINGLVGGGLFVGGSKE